MGKLIATIKLEHEYGHSGNRPSEAAKRKALSKALDKAIEDASAKRLAKPFNGKDELCEWSFVGIEVK
jgi:hypothetical protein